MYGNPTPLLPIRRNPFWHLSFRIEKPRRSSIILRLTNEQLCHIYKDVEPYIEVECIDRRRFRSLHLDEILDIGDKYHSKNINLLMEYALKIMLGRQE